MKVVYLSCGQESPDGTGDFVEVVARAEPGPLPCGEADIRCRYTVNMNQIEFRKMHVSGIMDFDQALDWAKSFACQNNIPTVYAIGGESADGADRH